jgi:hypothetical protein
MSDLTRKIIGGTFIVAALVIILRDSTATNSIIRGLAEGYGDVVKALKAA